MDCDASTVKDSFGQRWNTLMGKVDVPPRSPHSAQQSADVTMPISLLHAMQQFHLQSNKLPTSFPTPVHGRLRRRIYGWYGHDSGSSDVRVVSADDLRRKARWRCLGPWLTRPEGWCTKRREAETLNVSFEMALDDWYTWRMQ